MFTIAIILSKNGVNLHNNERSTICYVLKTHVAVISIAFLDSHPQLAWLLHLLFPVGTLYH